MPNGKLDKARRNSVRLQGFNYADAATYYVTLVAENRALYFEREEHRDIVETAWRWLADRYEHVELDEFVVMPNHLHGLITLSYERRGGS
jgi:REP element-mobilizing transposase RayT